MGEGKPSPMTFYAVIIFKIKNPKKKDGTGVADRW